MDRQEAYRTVYNTKRWKELRSDHLNTRPLCARCQAAGLTIGATIVHHITPIRAGGDPWDPANLESLCQSCHNAEHNPPAPVRVALRKMRERFGQTY